MNEKTLRIAKPVLVAATLATIFWVSAGSLTPPVGPIAATPGPEPRVPINSTTAPGDANSLFKITQPGSYYLTGNITGVVGKNGIGIAASGVTLDLNGFDLLGVAGSLDGVNASFGMNNVAVVNGSVRNWPADGVDLSSIDNTRLADLRVTGNIGVGISARDNAVVTGCAAYRNVGGGIRVMDTNSISNCSARDNSGTGISAAYGSTITNCSAALNTGDGISAAYGSTITNCSAYDNSGNGINVSNGSSVVDCTARVNTLDGIQVMGDCTVRGNTCDYNGLSAGDGAGIHATGTDNHIEGNNCTDADRGIDVDVAGNFITRNTCSSNTTNWDVVTGNVILVVNATKAGAVSGNSGGTAPGSTDPNANFSY